MKFKIPAGTLLAPGGFFVAYESQFNPAPGGSLNFALSSFHGDRVVLSAVDGTGALTGYVDEADFGPAPSGRSFGRVVTSVGATFGLLSAATFGRPTFSTVEEFRQGKGALNSEVFVPPVVLDEIHYHPAPTLNESGSDMQGLEFVEVFNRSASAVELFDPAHATNTWRLAGGIAFEFPSNTRIAAGGRVVVVGFDPVTNAPAVERFRSFYRLSTAPRLMGPFAGKLSNRGEGVALRMPDAPEPAPSDNAGEVAYIEVDRVRYQDTAPWPVDADGKGSSLQRRQAGSFGNEPQNWIAAAPTPGAGQSAGDVDSDGDGILDAWEALYGLDAKNPSDAALDRDGDGLSNLDEFRQGTNPADSTNPLRLTVSLVGTEAALSARFQFWAAPGERYQLQIRTDETTSTWTDTGTVLSASVLGVIKVNEKLNPAPGGRYFRVLRIKTTGP